MTIFSAIIARDALKLALDRADKVTERRTSTPILSCVYLQATAGAVMIRAFDCDIELRQSIPALDVPESAIGAAVCVSLASLRDFAGRADKGAYIELTEGQPAVARADNTEAKSASESAAATGKMTLVSGRARASVPTWAAADFPAPPAVAPVATIPLDLATLAHDLARVSAAVSTEETRYYLNGVYIHRAETRDGARLVMVATDGHRLLKVTRAADDVPEAFGGFIMPRKAVAVFATVAGKKTAGDVTMTIGGKGSECQRVKIAGDGWTLDSKVVDGTFPDYTRVIPSIDCDPITIDAASFAATVKRVVSVASGRTRAVTLKAAGGVLNVACHCVENGDSAEDVPAAWSPREGGVGFNAAYIGALMALAPKGGAVALYGDDDAAPWRVEYEGAPELMAVQMPMRGNDTGGFKADTGQPAESAYLARLAYEAGLTPQRAAPEAVPIDDAAAPEAASEAPEAPAAVLPPEAAPEAASGPESAPVAAIEPDAPADDVAEGPEGEAAPIDDIENCNIGVNHAEPMPAPDLAATVAELLARVAALESAQPGPVPVADESPARARAIDAESRLGQAAIDADASHAQGERVIAAERAALREARADLAAMTAERDALAAESAQWAQWSAETRQRTAGRLRAIRATAREVEQMHDSAVTRGNDALRDLLAEQGKREALGRDLARMKAANPLAGMKWAAGHVGATVTATRGPANPKHPDYIAPVGGRRAA